MTNLNTNFWNKKCGNTYIYILYNQEYKRRKWKWKRGSRFQNHHWINYYRYVVYISKYKIYNVQK